MGMGLAIFLAAVTENLVSRKGAENAKEDKMGVLSSGGVADYFEFGEAVYRGEQCVDARHGGVFEFGVATLAALEDRQGFDDDDGGVTDLERQICLRDFRVCHRRPGISFCDALRFGHRAEVRSLLERFVNLDVALQDFR